MSQGERKASLTARVEELVERTASKYIEMSKEEIRSLLGELEKDMERLLGHYK